MSRPASGGVPLVLSDPRSDVVLHAPGRDPALVVIGLEVALGLSVLAADSATVRWVAGLATVAAVAVTWAYFVRPRLEVRPHGLVVVATLRPRRLSWAEVDGFEGRSSLVVHRTEGRPVHAPAVMATLRRRRGSASLPVATAVSLNDRLTRIGVEGEPVLTSPRRPPQRPVWVDPALVLGGLLVGLLLLWLLSR